MSAGSAFRPSDVPLRRPVPLVGTMGKAEVEAAAAWLVLALRDNGDEWGGVAASDLKVVQDEHSASLLWLTNPFLVPDFDGLVDRGFAEFVGAKRRVLRFTSAGIQALKTAAGSL